MYQIKVRIKFTGDPTPPRENRKHSANTISHKRNATPKPCKIIVSTKKRKILNSKHTFFPCTTFDIRA